MTLGRFGKMSFMPLADCFLLVIVGAIPLVILDVLKVVQHTQRKRKTEPDE
jgi:Ca2+-transporting ATPase